MLGGQKKMFVTSPLSNRGLSEQSLLYNSGRPSRFVFSTGLFPVAEFYPLEGQEHRGKGEANPSEFPVSDQHLTGERGRVLESLCHPSNDRESRQPLRVPQRRAGAFLFLGLKK